jgi:hypothetical protein
MVGHIIIFISGLVVGAIAYRFAIKLWYWFINKILRETI